MTRLARRFLFGGLYLVLGSHVGFSASRSADLIVHPESAGAPARVHTGQAAWRGAGLLFDGGVAVGPLVPRGAATAALGHLRQRFGAARVDGAALGALLAFAIALQTRKRRQLDTSLRQWEQFEAGLVDVLIATAQTHGRSAPHILTATLRRIADAVGVDDVWLWEFGDPQDPDWGSLRLQCGESVTFTAIDQLPRPLRARLEGRPQPAQIVATPLNIGGAGFGALFWVAADPRAVSSLSQLDRFRAFSILLAWDVQRARARRALERSDALKTAILSSLPASVAVLDRHGIVLAVNESGAESPWPLAPRANYIDASRTADGMAATTRADALRGVTEVCEGKRRDFEIDYRMVQAAGERWFHMKVTALKRNEGGAVVTHTDITERKHAELLVRESEERFRRLADALPVGVWLSGTDGACSYVNRTWLNLTGRPIERECGVGWLEALHPDDRERCMGAYLRAFGAREAFSIECRIRRYDGEYRWLINKGIPLYDLDTTFLGYLGGAIDFTDQRNAERALRELSGKLIAAQEDERRRIALELHDSVSQRMALIAIRLDELQRLISPDSDSAAIVQLLIDDSATVARELHAMSHRLHSAKLDALGLVEAVASHCREMTEQGVLVQFSVADLPSLPASIALCLFRIVQEALANVAKHSGADSARVTMMRAGDVIVLRIVDGGCGFVPERRFDGLGLVSLRERARAVGGDVCIQSAPGQGTEIEARIPIPSTSPTVAERSVATSSAPEQCPPLLLLSDGTETSVG